LPRAPTTPPLPTTRPVYPDARRDDTVEIHHGIAVADPYRWLEAMGAAETSAWVDAQSALADHYLSRLPGREQLRARIEALMSYERFGLPRHGGNGYFWTHNDGKHGQAVVLSARTPDSEPTTVLDPDQLSTDGSLALAGWSVGGNGRFAYGVARGGGDWQTWKLRDPRKGRDLAAELPHVKYYRPVFNRDGTGIYYSRFPTPPPGTELTAADLDCKVWFHQLGTRVERDIVIYERPDKPTWQFEPLLTRDGRFLVISIGDGQVGDRGQEQIAYLDLRKPGAKVVSLIDTFEAEYVFVGNDGPIFYFKTTLGAPRKRVIAIDIRAPARGHWKTIVPEGADAIDDVSLVGGQLFVSSLRDAHSAVSSYDLQGRKIRDVMLPGLGTVYGFSGAPGDKQTFFFFTDFAVPGTVYRYDIASGKSRPWKAPKVPFDSSAIETRQVFFPSKDGTSIPMFVTAKKGITLDGARPTIMTAYGFGGIPSLPWFDPPMIAWLERGGVSVLVNIRGGGEYGEAWHAAAMRTRRQVGIDDFIAAGEWLIANKYTSAANLGIIGTSGGGMLVGSAMVQRPDLFGASVAIAGVLDLLRFPLFGQGAGWQGDMGSPEDPAEFQALLTTSALHNVRKGTYYPPTLVVTSDSDSRVAPLHSYKFAAALQYAQAGNAPILLSVETKSGHGGGSTRRQQIDQQTDILSFLARHLGLALDGALP
jgi:prolyl oligopeptidase